VVSREAEEVSREMEGVSREVEEVSREVEGVSREVEEVSIGSTPVEGASAKVGLSKEKGVSNGSMPVVMDFAKDEASSN